MTKVIDARLWKEAIEPKCMFCNDMPNRMIQIETMIDWSKDVTSANNIKYICITCFRPIRNAGIDST
jgi:hypothetical protein